MQWRLSPIWDWRVWYCPFKWDKKIIPQVILSFGLQHLLHHRHWGGKGKFLKQNTWLCTFRLNPDCFKASRSYPNGFQVCCASELEVHCCLKVRAGFREKEEKKIAIFVKNLSCHFFLIPDSSSYFNNYLYLRATLFTDACAHIAITSTPHPFDMITVSGRVCSKSDLVLNSSFC